MMGPLSRASCHTLLLGGLASLFGVTIYYVLPLAVITLNLGLMLEIFFVILLGMILGLTLIAFNVQRMVKMFLIYTLLFFER